MNLKIVKKRNPLAKSFAQSIEGTEAQVEIRKLSIVEELLQFMKQADVNRTELAERMGVPPSRITKMLSGDSNLTIDTLVRAGRAVGADLAQTFVPQGNRVKWLHYANQSTGNQSISFEPAADIKPIKQALSPKLSNEKPAEHDAEDAA